MKTKHLVLRATERPIGFDPFLGAAGSPTPRGLSFGTLGERISAASFGQTKLEVDELDFAGVSRVSSMADVIAIAPAMPTKLIAPRIENLADAQNQPAGTAWGVDAVGATTCPIDGRGIIPAIIDTGIERTHPAFGGVNLKEKDFTQTGDGDGNGHGTHCAGTVFGRSVNGLRIGVAPGVQTALVGKVLDQQGRGSTESCFRAVQWAVDSGANVISMSLGLDFPGFVQAEVQRGLPVDLATSMGLEAYRLNVRLFEQLMAFVKARGAMLQAAILVAAAGNENRRFKDPTWDITVAPPAVAEGILSVGAVGRGPVGLECAEFSNSGVNFVAPGVGIHSAHLGGGLVAMSGTSMATPHVAGVAVLWAQWLRTRNLLTPFNLEARLAASATLVPLAPGFEPADVGLGIVSAPLAA